MSILFRVLIYAGKPCDSLLTDTLNTTMFAKK